MTSKPTTNAAFALGLIMSAVLVTFTVQDFDTFWHLANGRAMVGQHRIVSEELFSYTRAGAHFYNHEWLSQLVLYLAYAAAGAMGLAALKVALAAIVFTFEYRTLRALGLDSVWAALIALFAIYLGLERYRERPEIFSLAFLSLLVWLIYGVRGGAINKRALYAIPIIFGVWELFHGAVYGLVFFGAYVGAASTGRREERELAWKIAALTFLVLLISPYGLRNYSSLLSLAGKGLMVTMNEEFQRTPLIADYLPYWGLLAATWTLAAIFYKDADRVHLATLLLFTVLSIKYQRATAAFALVAAPVIGRYIFIASARWELRHLRTALAIILLGVIVALKFFTPGAPAAFAVGVDEQRLPVGATRFIKATDLAGNMYNPGNFGGLLAYELYPRRKIFLYNHHEVFEQVLGESLDRRFIDRYRIDYALIGPIGSMDEDMFKRGWVTVYWDTASRLLVRDTPENSSYLARFALKYYLPDVSPAMALEYEPARMQLLAEAARVCSFAYNPQCSAFLGLAVIKYKNSIAPANARALIEFAMRRNPTSPELLRALSLFK